MRTHPVYAAFDRRWQLPVYFQMRWKGIVTKLEEVLVVTKLERMPTKGTVLSCYFPGFRCRLTRWVIANAPFVTAQGAAIWEAITTCWSAEVYIPELSHRFWKFNLQVCALNL